MRNLAVAVLGVFLLLFSGSAYAQPEEKGEGELREERVELVEVLLIWKLVDRLGLSEEQLVRFLPRWKEDKELKKQHRLERKERLKELESLARSEDEEVEERLAVKLAEMEKWEAGFQEKVKAIREEMKNVLTVRQRALLLVSLERFGREVRKTLERVRERRELRRGLSRTPPIPPFTERPGERR